MEATQNGAAAIGVIGDAGGKPLPTALFGFRKGDVLAAIDALMKSNAEQQRALGEQLAGLQQELQAAQEDKTLVLEKTRELCEKLSAQEEAGRRLEQAAASAKKESETFKVKLFASEKENYALRQETAELRERASRMEQALEQAKETQTALERAQQEAAARAAQADQLHTENERLTGRVEELELSLDGWKAREAEIGQAESRAREEAARVKREADAKAAQTAAGARRDADKILADANRAAVHLHEDAQAQAEQRREAAVLGAQEMDRSVQLLRSQLEAVERQMDEAYASLKAATERIQKAAADVGAQTEQVNGAAARLDAPRQTADAVSPAAPGAQPRQESAPCRPRAAEPHAAEPKARSLSDLVLEKLAHILS